MSYLEHHGIQGQKWGVQNGPPYPLDTETHKEVVSADDKRMTIKKGTKIQRIANWDEKGKTGSTYAAYTPGDKKLYAGKFAWGRGSIKPDFVQKCYMITLSAKRDLVGPSKNERLKIYKSLVKKDEFANEIAEFVKKHKHDMRSVEELAAKIKDVKNDTNLMVGYFWMTQAIGDQSISVGSTYFNTLAKKGFDFVRDDYDERLGFGRQPVILLNREDSTNYEGARKYGFKESLLNGLETPLKWKNGKAPKG